MKTLGIHGLKKEFFSLRRGKVPALKGIDLDIAAGSFFVLLGPSGCGKSTLLNLIAGIEKPTAGEIVIGDRVVASPEKNIFLSPRRRDIAMVFQSYALYPHMTVHENIAFPLKIAKLDKEEIRKRVHDAASILEIDPILDAKPRELSGGQRQRVALGRAIVRKPNLLLLDEPLSNLDALLRTSMRSELKQIQRRLKVTTVYVTHDQVEAMSLGDRIAVFEAGNVQQVGTPDEIYHDPENLFVARFVGSPPINVVPGTLLGDLLGRLGKKLPSYEEITVGIRPEHIHVRESGVLEGKIDLIGSLGSEILLYATVEGAKITAKVADASGFKEGDRVKIGFEQHHMLLFGANGRRLR